MNQGFRPVAMVSSSRAGAGVSIALRAMLPGCPSHANNLADCRSACSRSYTSGKAGGSSRASSIQNIEARTFLAGKENGKECRGGRHRFSFKYAVSGVDIEGLCRRWSPSGVRRLWVSVPVQMGRRSCKIATRKGAQAAKKMKIHQRIGKQIAKSVRENGPNPVSNLTLAALLQEAREHNFPKDIIEKQLKKATEKGQQDYIESTYEAYGFGGVGFVMEVLTDNPNRANASIRDVVRKNGGKMADPGSVMFGFKRAGVVAVKADQMNGDELLLAAMDAGAEDVIEPESPDDEDDSEERYYKVVMPVEQFGAVNAKLREARIPVDSDNSGLELIPLATVEADDEAMDLNKVLVDKLLELDDVDAVYSTQK